MRMAAGSFPRAHKASASHGGTDPRRDRGAAGPGLAWLAAVAAARAGDMGVRAPDASHGIAGRERRGRHGRLDAAVRRARVVPCHPRSPPDGLTWPRRRRTPHVRCITLIADQPATAKLVAA